MAHTYTLLSPVKEAEFRLTFGHTELLNSGVNASEVFAPTIAHFKNLAIGPYFWFIADTVNWKTIAVGGSLEQMTSIKEIEFVNKSPEILFRHTHPVDVPHMLAFSNYWVNFYSSLSSERKAHVKASIYLRLLNAHNTYSWFMTQYIDNIIDDQGKIHFGLTLVTDISHIKTEGVSIMSILDTYNDSCQQFSCIDGKEISTAEIVLPKLSAREIEVLRYLAIGHSSKQIASKLNIAIKTIDNHRQNMLRKANAKSTGELVAFGINMGYV